MIGQAGQHDVAAQGGLKHQAGTAAVLGDHAQVVLNGVLGAPEVDLLALYKYLTCIRPASAEYGFHNLRAARAYQAVKAQDLAGIGGEADVLEFLFAGQALHPQHFLAGGMRLAVIIVLDLPAHHAVYDLGFSGVLDHAGLYLAAVPEDGGPVAHAEDLRHAVGNINNGYLIVAQIIQLLKQRVDFVLRQG